MTTVGIIFGVIVMLCVLGGANFYIARRFYQCVSFIFPQVNLGIYTGAFVLIALIMVFGFARSLLPVPMAVRTVLGYISSYWMGIFIYLLLLFVVADVVLLAGSLAKIIPSPMPHSVRFHAGWIVVLLTVAVSVYGIYNANQIKRVSYDVQIEKYASTSELNIVMISDLHLGAVSSESRLDKMVEEINHLEPDLVCIAGDIFDNDYYAIHSPDEITDVLKNITAKYGVYASLGNHDGGETLNEMTAFLERSNINVLNDEYVVIDERLILVGRVDSSPIGGFGDMVRKEWEEVAAGFDPNLKFPVVVMDHNPANIGEYGNEVDLVLSGHTHRGQIFPGSLFTRMMFEVDYGYYRKDSNSPHVVVTSGVGTWGMPMRVGTNCEIVSIKLH